nr:hypothetical protein [Tanacetum cinerariifolium]
MMLKLLKNHSDLMIPTLKGVENHTTSRDIEGTPIHESNSEEIVASQPNPKVAKKSKALVKRKVPTFLARPSRALQPKRKMKLKHKALEAGYNTPALEQDDDVEDPNQDNDLSVADYCTYLESSLEKDVGNYPRVVFVLNLRSSKRIGLPPPHSSNTAPSDPGYTDTSNVANAPSFDHIDAR